MLIFKSFQPPRQVVIVKTCFTNYLHLYQLIPQFFPNAYLIYCFLLPPDLNASLRAKKERQNMSLTWFELVILEQISIDNEATAGIGLYL